MRYNYDDQMRLFWEDSLGIENFDRHRGASSPVSERFSTILIPERVLWVFCYQDNSSIYGLILFKLSTGYLFKFLAYSLEKVLRACKTSIMNFRWKFLENVCRSVCPWPALVSKPLNLFWPNAHQTFISGHKLTTWNSFFEHVQINPYFNDKKKQF